MKSGLDAKPLFLQVDMLNSSLTTRFSKYVTRFILVLSFVCLVLNHSSAYMVVLPKSQETA